MMPTWKQYLSQENFQKAKNFFPLSKFQKTLLSFNNNTLDQKIDALTAEEYEKLLVALNGAEGNPNEGDKNDCRKKILKYEKELSQPGQVSQMLHLVGESPEMALPGMIELQKEIQAILEKMSDDIQNFYNKLSQPGRAIADEKEHAEDEPGSMEKFDSRDALGLVAAAETSSFVDDTSSNATEGTIYSTYSTSTQNGEGISLQSPPGGATLVHSDHSTNIQNSEGISLQSPPGGAALVHSDHSTNIQNSEGISPHSPPGGAALVHSNEDSSKNQTNVSPSSTQTDITPQDTDTHQKPTQDKNTSALATDDAALTSNADIAPSHATMPTPSAPPLTPDDAALTSNADIAPSHATMPTPSAPPLTPSAAPTSSTSNKDEEKSRGPAPIQTTIVIQNLHVDNRQFHVNNHDQRQLTQQAIQINQQWVTNHVNRGPAPAGVPTPPPAFVPAASLRLTDGSVGPSLPPPRAVQALQLPRKNKLGRLPVRGEAVNISEGLYQAVCKGEIHVVRQYLTTLQARLLVNIPYHNNNTLVHYAARWGQVEVLKFFVKECEADLTKRNSFSRTPLEEAECYGDVSKAAFDYLKEVVTKPVQIEKPQQPAEVKRPEVNPSDVLPKVNIFSQTPNPVIFSQTPNPVASTYTEVKSNEERPKLSEAEQAELNQTLIAACTSDADLAHVRSLLEKGADANAKDRQIQSGPLHYATFNGHLPLTKLLVEEYHADVNASGYHGNTPFSYAVCKNHLPIVKLLVESYQADINRFNESSNPANAFMLAAYHGRTEIIKYLFSTGKVDVNQTNKLGQTVLYFAITSEIFKDFETQLNVVECLVKDCNADVSIKDNDRIDPIGRLAKMIQKVKAPADVTVLQRLDGIKFYLEAVKSFRASYPKDPLPSAKQLMATRKLRKKIRKNLTEPTREEVLALLEEKADVNFQGERRRTALHMATEKGYFATVKLLVEKGANPDLLDEKCHPPLWYAGKKHNDKGNTRTYLNIAECLKEKSTIKGKWDDTSLHTAVRHGLPIAMIKRCLSQGVGVNQYNSDGETAAHVAVHYNREEALKYLLEEHSVDVHFVNNAKYSVIQLAIVENRLQMVVLLISNSLKKGLIDQSGLAELLYFAASKGNLFAVQYLVETQGVDVNSKPFADRNTPLHAAVIGKHVEVVKYLVERPRLNRIAFNAKFQTPLQVADPNGPIMALLLPKTSSTIAKSMSKAVIEAKEDKSQESVAVHILPEYAQAPTKSQEFGSLIEIKSADQTAETRESRAFLILIDKSGSMTGDPITTLLKSIKCLAKVLQVNKDFISIVAFNDTTDMLVPPTLFNEKIARKINELTITTGGGTNFRAVLGILRSVCESLQALQKNQLAMLPNMSHKNMMVDPVTVMFFTDAQQDYSGYPVIFEASVNDYLGDTKKLCAIYGFGIGQKYDRRFMQKLLKDRNGFEHSVPNENAIESEDLYKKYAVIVNRSVGTFMIELTPGILCQNFRVMTIDNDMETFSRGNQVIITVTGLVAGTAKYIECRQQLPNSLDGQNVDLFTVVDPKGKEQPHIMQATTVYWPTINLDFLLLKWQLKIGNILKTCAAQLDIKKLQELLAIESEIESQLSHFMAIVDITPLVNNPIFTGYMKNLGEYIEKLMDIQRTQSVESQKKRLQELAPQIKKDLESALYSKPSKSVEGDYHIMSLDYLSSGDSSAPSVQSDAPSMRSAAPSRLTP